MEASSATACHCLVCNCVPLPRLQLRAIAPHVICFTPLSLFSPPLPPFSEAHARAHAFAKCASKVSVRPFVNPLSTLESNLSLPNETVHPHLFTYEQRGAMVVRGRAICMQDASKILRNMASRRRARYVRDTCEMRARCRRGAGVVQASCRLDAGKMQARCETRQGVVAISLFAGSSYNANFTRQHRTPSTSRGVLDARVSVRKAEQHPLPSRLTRRRIFGQIFEPSSHPWSNGPRRDVQRPYRPSSPSLEPDCASFCIDCAVSAWTCLKFWSEHLVQANASECRLQRCPAFRGYNVALRSGATTLCRNNHRMLACSRAEDAQNMFSGNQSLPKLRKLPQVESGLSKDSYIP
eukprot:1306582-Pleurochrysis_carterae.AAC.2